MKFKTKITVLSIGFAIAIGIVLYPFFANIHNNKVAQELIALYDENVSAYTEEELQAALENALEYNQSLTTGGILSEFEGSTTEKIYESLLNISGDGVMGYIVIPSIDVSLPIYHYTEDEVLKKGVGHIETSSLPVGGTSSHCLLSGHRGLPGSKLFTDLDQIEEGDVFYLKVLGQTLAYEVTSIQVVEPDEVDSLGITAGEDLCTLITCTPYGINTHRLLITGTRTEYIEDDSESQTGSINIFSRDYILLYAAALELVIFIFVICRMIKNEKQEKKEAA